MTDDLTPTFRRPTEREKQEADPNADMCAYFAYHTARHREKLREKNQSRGVYITARRRDYPDEWSN